jgi:myo-inositol-1(or 4)-monophosphatase
MTDTTELDRRFAFLPGLIEEAGALANDYFNRLHTLTIRSKGAQDMVSEADEDTEKLIRKRLGEAFPGDGFLGEETGLLEPEEGRGIWVVDPIDGTQPFVSGLRSWCVSVGYVQDGEIEFGAVYDPANRELFLGRRGGQATMNGQPIAPHAGKALTQGLVSVGHSPRVPADRVLAVLSNLLHAGGMYHRNGSGALCLCYVACGRVLGYVECHINAWDCVGAIAVVRAAGGRTNDFLAGDGLKNGNPIIAGTPAVYDALQALMPA